MTKEVSIWRTEQPDPKYRILCTYSRQGGHKEPAVVTMHDDIDHIDLCADCIRRAAALLEDANAK